MNRIARAFSSFALCLGLLHAGLGIAHAAGPGKLIIGYPPGQSVDIIGRLLADRLSQTTERKWIVESMPGQSGSIALAAVARMPADGSVMTLSASAALAGNPFLYTNVRYDPIKDFEPIGLMYDAPLLLLVNAALPVKSLPELLAYLRAHPGQLSYSSPGNGSVSHLAMSELLRRSGTSMTHVPYQGASKSLADLAGGQVQVSFDAIAAAQPFLASGKIRAIAISSKERVAVLPDIPTVSESGIEGFDMVPWVGLLAPAGTPRDAVDKLSVELGKIVQSEDFSRRVVSLGGRPRTAPAAEFRSFLRSEVTRWSGVIKTSGAKLE
ncbi:Argininosuccinate lyase (plasmid) [Variovorax sp. SRS16]|uniref:Bug family tripartite tricarboxylate transporter substrate binding protein n=1 Tax=Variovorax sp. SRS16 TaxID=282217 RepID=UPI001317C74F|nr:tripartite tricarboxylate transporter substrate binding protein [Variovorax sp. SRS16]VTU46679.1 Argininosuccinate lyase [Variovorax sp. SRS16]